MKQKLVILTVAQSPGYDMKPLLLEFLSEQQIVSVSLLDALSRQQITEKYAPRNGEKSLVVRLADGTEMLLATSRIACGLQQLIHQLEARGAENILPLGCEQFTDLQARSALLIAPDRLIPPLINAVVGDQQAGIIVSADELLRQQAGKWRSLSKPACFAVADPLSDNGKLRDAGLLLLEQGADVVVLDSPGFHSRHCDFLQQLLGIPVLLAWRLLAEMAPELLA